MIKKLAPLAVLAFFALPSFAFAAGITLAQSSGTSSAVYYTPATPIGFGPDQTVIAVFRPDGTLVDLAIYPNQGFECTGGSGHDVSTSDYVDISQDFDINCNVQGRNPYGVYTFVEAPPDYLASGCVWTQYDSHGHAAPTDFRQCIDSHGPLATYATYDWLPPDTTPPVIALNDSSTMSIAYGADFADPGATAIDDRDGTDTVLVGGDVVDNSSTPGTYTITYDATDAAGNQAAQAIRTVVVEPKAKKAKALTPEEQLEKAIEQMQKSIEKAKAKLKLPSLLVLPKFPK